MALHKIELTTKMLTAVKNALAHYQDGLETQMRQTARLADVNMVKALRELTTQHGLADEAAQCCDTNEEIRFDDETQTKPYPFY